MRCESRGAADSRRPASSRLSNLAFISPLSSFHFASRISHLRLRSRAQEARGSHMRMMRSRYWTLLLPVVLLNPPPTVKQLAMMCISKLTLKMALAAI